MKKVVSLFLTVVIFLTLAVGCGQKLIDSVTIKTDPTNEAIRETKIKSEPQNADLKVFMTLARFKDQFDKYFEQFKAKEQIEKNIIVNINLEMPNADQAEQILKTRLASNDSPDLFNLHANNLPLYYKAGYLSNLSTQPFVKTLFENVKRIVTIDNKVVALPMESLAWGYLYNKQIFTSLGLAPPQTLDEMKVVVNKLEASNITPFLLAFQESWIPQLMMALSLGGTVSSEHPDFVDKMNKGVGSYKDVESVFDIIDIIMQNGTSKPFEEGNAAASADFANGKAAMWVQGSWQAEAILKVNPEMKIGVAPLPISNDSKGAMINLAVSTSLALSPTSKYEEAAADLLNYFLDPRDSSTLYEQLKFNPVASFEKYSTFPWVDEASIYVSRGKAYEDLSLPQAVTDETAKMLQSYYAKQVTKEDIIKDLDKTWAASNKNDK